MQFSISFLLTKFLKKTGESFNQVISYIRCKLSFIILKSALLCIRGSRSFKPFANAVTDVGDDFGLYGFELGI